MSTTQGESSEAHKKLFVQELNRHEVSSTSGDNSYEALALIKDSHLHPLAFYLHIKPDWIQNNIGDFSQQIHNALNQVLTHFRFPDSQALTLQQQQCLLNRVQSRIDDLLKDVLNFIKKPHFLCPCGGHFSFSNAFWAHHRACRRVQRHVCSCGFYFSHHAAWVKHVLAQDWPLCSANLCAHMFALKDSGSSPPSSSERPVDRSGKCFQCAGCHYSEKNYFLHYIHLAFCKEFLNFLELNCPFCQETNNGLDEHNTMVRQQYSLDSQFSQMENPSPDNAKWSLLLLKFCLVLGIPPSDWFTPNL